MISDNIDGNKLGWCWLMMLWLITAGRFDVIPKTLKDVVMQEFLFSSLSQWPNFKLFGITYLVGKIKFQLFFSGSIGWVSQCSHILLHEERLFDTDGNFLAEEWDDYGGVGRMGQIEPAAKWTSLRVNQIGCKTNWVDDDVPFFLLNLHLFYPDLLNPDESFWPVDNQVDKVVSQLHTWRGRKQRLTVMTWVRIWKTWCSMNLWNSHP